MVIGMAIATAVVGDMDATISAPSSLESLSSSLPPILPTLPTRAVGGRGKKRALMAIASASLHPHALQKVDSNGSFGGGENLIRRSFFLQPGRMGSRI